MSELQELATKVNICTDCALSEGRTLAVPGEGPERADLMFIGEAPGYYEDQQGRPFVGPAGRFLEQLLNSIGMSREQVFIANMIKCRPPSNRDPLPNEVATCAKYLDRQLQLVEPKVVVTLGRHSMAKFLPGTTIGKAHGKAVRKESFILYPIYHPAAALHQHALRSIIEDEFKVIPSLLQEQVTPPPQAERPAQQLPLL